MSKKKRDQYTEAYTMYYPMVMSAIHSKVSNMDDVQDICQDVFIKLYEKIDEVENIRKWLYGALRLSVFEHYRKNKGDVNIDSVFSDIAMTFVNGFKDTRIIIEETLDKLDTILKDQDKVLFQLVAIHKYSYTETAKELNLTKRKVEYRYKKIVDEILIKLQEKGIKNIEDLL